MENLLLQQGLLAKSGCNCNPSRAEKQNVDRSCWPPRTVSDESMMRERVWWQGLSVDIAAWVEKCQGYAMAESFEKCEK